LYELIVQFAGAASAAQETSMELEVAAVAATPVTCAGTVVQEVFARVSPCNEADAGELPSESTATTVK
jgi:hypothetical protein